MDKKWQSRKFAIALLGVLSATGLCAFDKIDDGVYSTIMIAVIGMYSLANVWQGIALQTKASPPANPSE